MKSNRKPSEDQGNDGIHYNRLIDEMMDELVQ